MPTDYEGGTLTGTVYAALVNGEYVKIQELENVSLEEADEYLGKYDYVRVVRCKDCEFTDESLDGDYSYWCLRHGSYVNDDDYCSYGERRTNEP